MSIDTHLSDKQVTETIKKAFQELLEEKHLYQNVRVNLESAASQLPQPTIDSLIINNSRYFSKCGIPLDTPSSAQALNTLARLMKARVLRAEKLPWVLVPSTESGDFRLDLPTVCRPCANCKAINPPHNPCNIRELVVRVFPVKDNDATVQVFALPYLCQACKKETVIWNVRREGVKLQLVGRSNIDKTIVPPHFPEELSDLYNECQIALQVGKQPAASTYLRGLIEAHVRSKVPGLSAKCRGDELFVDYKKLLPPNYPQPEFALGKAYDKLSSVIHTCAPDTEAVAESLSIVDRHFRILAVFPLIPVEAGSKDDSQEMEHNSDQPCPSD